MRISENFFELTGRAASHPRPLRTVWEGAHRFAFAVVVDGETVPVTVEGTEHEMRTLEDRVTPARGVMVRGRIEPRIGPVITRVRIAVVTVHVRAGYGFHLVFDAGTREGERAGGVSREGGAVSHEEGRFCPLHEQC